MNWIDLTVVLILSLSAAISFFRGFTREVLTIGAFVGTVALTLLLGPLVLPLVQGEMGYRVSTDGRLIGAGGAEPGLTDLGVMYGIAYGGTAVVILILLSLLAGFLSRFVQKGAVGAIDRSLGVLFGLGRGLILAALGFLLLSLLAGGGEAEGPDQDPAWLREAQSYGLMSQTAGWLKDLLPDRVPGLPGGGEADADAAPEEGVMERADPTAAPAQVSGLAVRVTEPDPDGEGLGYTEEQRDQVDRLVDETAPVPR